MSDGPHKCLPMRPEWKRVAERATNEAYSAYELCEAIVVAVQKDLQMAAMPGFLKQIQEVFSGKTLFCKDPIPYLEDLGQRASVNVMGQALLDFLFCAIKEGKSGHEALLGAFAAALVDHMEGRARQVEEHCLRDPCGVTARNARERLENAIRLADIKLLTNRILFPGAKSPLRIAKHDKVDDGVEL